MLRRPRLALGRLAPHLALAVVAGLLLTPVVLVAAALAAWDDPRGRALSAGLLFGGRGAGGAPQLVWQLANTAKVALLTAVVALALGVPAGFACARLSFAGRRALLTGCLVAVVAPATLVLAPELLVAGLWRLSDSLVLLVVAQLAVALPAVVLLARAAFDAVPDRLFEVARLEGAGAGALFWEVALPSARGSLIALAAVVFALGWGEVLAASALLSGAEAMTMSAWLTLWARGEWMSLPIAALSLLTAAPALFAALAGGPRVMGLVAQAFKGPRGVG